MYFRGNLAEAEDGWRSVLADAQTVGARRVEAEAEHGLGNVLHRRGETHEGIPHLWRAFELSEDTTAQLRALGDLGLSFLTLGHVDAAEQALHEVVRRGGSGEAAINAGIELMHCASFRRDRVSFERWRDRVAAQFHEQTLPNLRADYYLKMGIGFARFGNVRRAQNEVRRALEIASAHGLHEMVFRIERLLDGLNDCGAADFSASAASTPVIESDSLREVSASLAALSQ
jgi:lipopolysaccharide biosynthesis regulator YciM